MKQKSKTLPIIFALIMGVTAPMALAGSVPSTQRSEPKMSGEIVITPAASKKKESGFSKVPRNSHRVIVVVNDQPITGYDVTQRIKLNSALQQRRGNSRKAALKELIDGIIQVSEAKRKKTPIGERRVDAAIKSMAKAAGTTTAKLKTRLRNKGVAFSALKTQIKSSLALRFLMQASGTRVGKISDAEVDRRLKKINSDPRLRGVTVYMLRQINLPVENTSSAMSGQLLQARAVEAQQIASKYRGCSTLRRAISGIYNVKLSNTVQADGSKLPPQMKKALLKAGRKKLIGPMRVARGIQMIAFCGTRKIRPQKVTKAQVKGMVRNEKFGDAAENIMRDLRRKAYIDYKVAGARP